MEHLTTSYVITHSNLPSFLLQHEPLKFESPSPYYLVIFSLTSKFMKILIYPIKTLLVQKYLISGKQINHENMEKLLDQLNSLNCTIIHTSGIVWKDDHYLYEIYLTGLDDPNCSALTKNITQIPGIDFLHDSIVRLIEQA